MKAYEARALVYRENKKLLGIKEIERAITEAAKAGKFDVSVDVSDAMGHVSDLEDHFKKEGFYTKSGWSQTGPNSSTHYLSLSWRESGE